ncbi:hypothetical protein IAD21_03317 [Abditibacteriota bacterium]|nr:hypothetical protein IAD21_03317 [Abditibacteriota bacterium]
MDNLIFVKTGKEIKEAIKTREVQLQERLARRNAALEVFLQDTRKVRSYVVRSASNPYYGHGRSETPILVGTDEISSEELQDVRQMCARIHEIEQELHRLSLITAHLNDGQKLELDLSDLMAYGFSAEGVTDVETS